MLYDGYMLLCLNWSLLHFLFVLWRIISGQTVYKKIYILNNIYFSTLKH